MHRCCNRLFLLSFLLLSWTLGAQEGTGGFRQGKAAFDRGDYAQAARDLLTFSQRNPQDPWADDGLFLAAVASIQGGQPDKGLEALRRLIRLYPSTPYTDKWDWWVGRAAWDLRDYTTAAQSFSVQAQKTTVPDVVTESRWWWGRSLEALGEKEQAYLVLSRTTGSDPWAQKSRFKGGQLALELQKYPEAAGLFEAFAQDSDPQVRSEALASLVRLSEVRGDGPGVEKWGTLYLKDYPSGPLAPPVTLALGRHYLNTNRGAEGEALVQKLTSHLGLGIAARSLLAQRRTVEGKWAEAFTLWAGLPAGELDSQQKRTRAYNAGLAAFKLSRWKDAAGWWRELLDGPADEAGAQARLSGASALFLAGQGGEAARWLESYLETYPQGDKRTQAADLLLRHYTSVKDQKAAERVVNLVLKGGISSSQAAAYLLERARLRTDRGDFIGGLEDVQTLLDRPVPREVLGETLYLGAYLYSLRNEPLRGERYLYRLIEEFPRSELRDRALLARGLAFYNAERWDEARANWQRLLRESPQSVHRPRALSSLALVQEKTGRVSEAAASAWESFGAAEDNEKPAALALAARLYSTLSPPKGLELWDRLFKDYPRSPEALTAALEAGRLLSAQGQEVQARDRWQAGASLARGASWESLVKPLVLSLDKEGKPVKEWLDRWRAQAPASLQLAETLVLLGDQRVTRGDLSAAQEVLALLEKTGQKDSVGLLQSRMALGVFAQNPTTGGDLLRAYFREYGQSPGGVNTARSLALLLAKDNRRSELDAWFQELQALSPLYTLRAEIKLAVLRLDWDLNWESGEKSFREFLGSMASTAQKTEAVLSAAEAALRQQKKTQAREFLSLLPPGLPQGVKDRAQDLSRQASQP